MKLECKYILYIGFVWHPIVKIIGKVIVYRVRVGNYIRFRIYTCGRFHRPVLFFDFYHFFLCCFPMLPQSVG